MRRISFALTAPQFLDGSKTVTRRKGWRNLQPGTRLLAVSNQWTGVWQSETLGVIEVVSVRREYLDSGLGWLSRVHGEVTRIEFKRVEPRPLDDVRLSPAMREAIRCCDRPDGHPLTSFRTGTKHALVHRDLVASAQTKVPPGCWWRLTTLGAQVARELREG